MTVSTLLIPRRIIIAEWPEMPKKFKVGQILSLDQKGEFTGIRWHEYTDEEPLHLTEHEKFPANMRELAWDEFREDYEMPSYLKRDDKIYSVKKYNYTNGTLHTVGGKYALKWFLKKAMPATQDEYEEYIKINS